MVLNLIIFGIGCIFFACIGYNKGKIDGYEEGYHDGRKLYRS